MNASASKGLLAALILTLTLLSACGGGGDNCPSCHDDARGDGYGGLVFGSAGDDSNARDLKDECGFDIYNNHNGGGGDTLEIAGCYSGGTPGLVLAWAYQSFSSYRICNPGYSGDLSTPLAPGECRVIGSYFR